MVTVAALTVGMVGLVGTASAQEDPYGSTTTTTDGSGAAATCGLSPTSASPGDTVTATVSDAPAGETVRIMFDGDEVGSGTADAEPLEIQFTVPDVAPGDYVVAAAGETFTEPCGPGAGGEFAVLGDTTDGGALPRTGFYIGGLLVAAAALLLAGRAIVGESKRRQRRTIRE